MKFIFENKLPIFFVLLGISIPFGVLYNQKLSLDVSLYL